MKNINEIKSQLIELKPFLFEKYKVKEIGIFGSYAKGISHQKSDLDILVSFEQPPDLFTFIELKNFLSERLKIKVDLVMKNVLKPNIGKKILEKVMYI
jgi:hypothetical protein